jgi:trigger factor
MREDRRERSTVDVDVRELGGSRYTVHISLDKAEVNDAFGKTFQELSKRGGIRGFRPGKVPRQIIERNYEADLIRAITYDDLLQSRLEKAMEEADLRPIDQLDVKHGTPPDEDELLAETIKAGLATEEEGEEAEADDAAEATDPAEAAEAADESASSPEESLEEAMEDVPRQEGEPIEFYATFTA